MQTKPRVKLNIAENLRARMAEAAVSQSQLAHRSGVNQPFISRLLKGHALPNVADLANIAEAMDCTVDELIQNPEPSLVN